jgi:uncharacterized membrane protein YphA (DoxX/SURF4 family)
MIPRSPGMPFGPQPHLAAPLLRLGLAISLVMLVTFERAQGSRTLGLFPGCFSLALMIAGLLVVLGLRTVPAASFSALAWAWATYALWRTGEGWFVHPVRGVLYVLLFSALAVTGPGPFSLDNVLRSRRQRATNRLSVE